MWEFGIVRRQSKVLYSLTHHGEEGNRKAGEGPPSHQLGTCSTLINLRDVAAICHQKRVKEVMRELGLNHRELCVVLEAGPGDVHETNGGGELNPLLVGVVGGVAGHAQAVEGQVVGRPEAVVHA